MSVLRPLPPRPNLEFEHKEAKALLRRLRAGDADALARARARHPAIDASAPDRIRLADAQLVVARDYGFASWPRLVRWFGDVDRQQHGQWPMQPNRREHYDATVRGWLAAHRDRRAVVGRALAAYVPRFYGMAVDEVFAAAVTEDDVRLAVARQYGAPSWEVLLERAVDPAAAQRLPNDWDDPMRDARAAMRAGDLDALRRVVEAHPALLHPPAYWATRGRNLLNAAIGAERERGVEAMRPIVAWLAAQGLDIRLEFDRQLCGRVGTDAEEVRRLLDRGADPNWVAPNGIPVLEHALLRYWDGAAVDVLAARATPRKALWIAAGLGDVDGVRRFLDRDGRPTAAARRIRPDFDAVGGRGFAPSLPDPDDEELLVEAFLVAMLNGRTAVLEYMASRGTPVNSMLYGTPLINIAVGNGWAPVVETLVRCGADLDLRGWNPTQTAREIARQMYAQTPDSPGRRRIAERCGLDPDAILAERDARPAAPPNVHPGVQEALALAGDDAHRLGQRDIRPENVLVGMLALRGGGMLGILGAGGVDVERFRTDLRDRVRPGEPRPERPALPLHPDAQAAVQAMVAHATERRRDLVTVYHLLHALVRPGDAPVAALLARYGANATTLIAALEPAL